MAKTKTNKHSHARLFSDISQCESNNLENHTVVADMDGSLLIGRNFFPYLAVAAFELGGVLRLLFLVLASPLAGLLYHLISESAGIRMLVFVTFVGTRMSDIESVARAVLPKFYSGDIHPEAWRVFSSCGRKCVITENPRIMVEPFVKEYLGADLVIGSEISAIGGRATGLVSSPRDLDKVFATRQPEIGIANRKTKFPFLELCKESYLVWSKHEAVSPVNPDKLLKRVMFHDGRLVQKPSPLVALAIILWFPIGLILAVIRIAAGTLLPMPAVYYACWALGVRVTVKGPRAQKSLSRQSGVLFVCSHRTLLDPVFLSIALARPIPAVTYSLSRLSEIISPIKTVRLHRDRIKDANIIKKLLQRGDLIIFPEGTTSREPILLRFSALFAELTDELVPVVMVNRTSMFHATTVRGWKGMDAFYFFMNPSPGYEVTFLNKLPYDVTCGAGKSSHDVANYIQSAIAATSSYECTNFTRKDKYRALVGNDGNVGG